MSLEINSFIACYEKIANKPTVEPVEGNQKDPVALNFGFAAISVVKEKLWQGFQKGEIKIKEFSILDRRLITLLNKFQRSQEVPSAESILTFISHNSKKIKKQFKDPGNNDYNKIRIAITRRFTEMLLDQIPALNIQNEVQEVLKKKTIKIQEYCDLADKVFTSAHLEIPHETIHPVVSFYTAKMGRLEKVEDLTKAMEKTEIYIKKISNFTKNNKLNEKTQEALGKFKIELQIRNFASQVDKLLNHAEDENRKTTLNEVQNFIKDLNSFRKNENLNSQMEEKLFAQLERLRAIPEIEVMRFQKEIDELFNIQDLNMFLHEVVTLSDKIVSFKEKNKLNDELLIVLSKQIKSLDQSQLSFKVSKIKDQIEILTQKSSTNEDVKKVRQEFTECEKATQLLIEENELGENVKTELTTLLEQLRIHLSNNDSLCILIRISKMLQMTDSVEFEKQRLIDQSLLLEITSLFSDLKISTCEARISTHLQRMIEQPLFASIEETQRALQCVRVEILITLLKSMVQQGNLESTVEILSVLESIQVDAQDLPEGWENLVHSLHENVYLRQREEYQNGLSTIDPEDFNYQHLFGRFAFQRSFEKFEPILELSTIPVGQGLDESSTAQEEVSLKVKLSAIDDLIESLKAAWSKK